MGTAVAQWLRYCATIGRSLTRFRMVSLEFFIDIDSASNRNEYQEDFLGVKVAGA